MVAPRGWGALLLSVGILWAREGHAEEQYNAGVISAWCRKDRSGGVSASSAWCNGFGGTIWWGRDRDRDLGFGLGAGIATHSFDDIEFALGPSAVLPALQSFPFILEVDGRVRLESSKFKPGLRGQLFWGPMSYNFHSNYSMATGIVFAVDRDFDGELTSYWVGLRLDAMWPAIPFIFGYELLAGPRD